MKLGKKLPMVAGLAACGLLTACETTPENQAQKVPPERQLREGMTKEEVRTLLGDPNNTGMSNQGETWMYQDTAKAFIPFYAIGGGKFHTTTVTFDNEGKVISWSTSEGGMY